MAVGSIERLSAGVEHFPAAHPRYEWLDEIRGIVALLYMVSVLTNGLVGDPIVHEKSLGPTYLNHGYGYIKAFPAIITVTDIGQTMFLFILGFAGYIAFTSRRNKNIWKTIGYAMRRVAMLYVLSFFEAGGLEWLQGKPFSFSMRVFLYDGVLGKLAVATICVYLFTVLLRRADQRLLLALGVMVLHALVYSFHYFDRYDYHDNPLILPVIPFGTINLAAAAVAGSAFSQWLQFDSADIHKGLKERILPISLALILASYCLEWLQPSEHHDATTSITLLGVGLSGFGLCTAYSMERANLQIPLLGALGRNLILVFIVFTSAVDMFIKALPEDRLHEMPFTTLLIVGILPIALMIGTVHFLDKRRIWLRL